MMTLLIFTRRDRLLSRFMICVTLLHCCVTITLAQTSTISTSFAVLPESGQSSSSSSCCCSNNNNDNTHFSDQENPVRTLDQHHSYTSTHSKNIVNDRTDQQSKCLFTPLLSAADSTLLEKQKQNHKQEKEKQQKQEPRLQPQSLTRVENPPSLPRNALPLAWRTVNALPIMMASKSLFPYIKTFGLRHKSTVNWRMRDKAKKRATSVVTTKEIISPVPSSHSTPDHNTNDEFKITPNNHTNINSTLGEFLDPELDWEKSTYWDKTMSAFEKDSEPGYFFHSQVLDHFYSPKSNHSSRPPPPLNNTFRQYYHISSEFYKPGGPIILWIPGESPLHSLFLRRGLAYELANATSGLLVALEHRFYGNSIPRLQDSRTSKKIDTTTTTTTIAANNIALDEENQAWTSMAKKISNPKTEPNNSIKTKTISTNKNYILKTSSTIKASKLKKTKGDVKSGSNSTSTKNNPQKNKDTTKETKNKSNGSRSAGEGLPLDLLTYLTVDQSIEDIAYFIDQFPTIQPTYFRDTSTNNTKLKSKSKLKSKITDTRWIIAGCSYGGNLAAWTRQRYPSKIFAVFASSAPVHSVLDFYEYSTSQSNIVGKQCAKRMEHARDFLDEALQMTDGFMKQMALLDLATTKNSKENMEKSLTTPESNPLEEKKELAFLGQVGEPERNGAYSLISATASHKDSKDNSSKGNDSNKSNKKNDKKAREAAKLRVLTWFSSDFAKEYALEGEEVHAAGWIWWTVASAVQYNGIVTPPTIQPPKTTVDILCDTMAQADNSGMGAGDSEDSNSDDGNNGTINSSSASANKTVSLRNLEYAQALASWFKYQQYFTPTRTEGLQPSDLDPNSAQNLASVAWLWQTCSELGYLQTSQPSTCGCPPISSTTTTTYTNQNQTKSTLKQKGESFNVNTLAIITEDSSDIYDGIVKKSKIPLSISPPFSHHKGKLLKSNPITKSTTSACLPCRGYASHRARVKESMFSRLLTLEAAWQECQYYFGTNATAQQSQPKPSGISRTNGKRIQKKVEEQLSRGIIIDKKGGINSNSNNTSSSVNLTGPLLRGYPDVDKNVNNKFHGWEIVEEAEIITWDERSRSYEFTTSSNRWQAADKIRSPSKKSNSMLAFDNQPSSTSSATLSYDPVDDSNGDFDSSYSSFGPSGNDDSGGGIGRYYFTNGENDPWKDLTLASPQAIEFMKRRSDKSKAKEHHLKSKLSTDIAMDREVSNPSPKSANHPDLKHHKSHHHHHHHRHNHNHNHHHKHKKHDHHSCYHRPHHRRRHDHHPSHHRYQHGSCIKSGHRIKQGSHTHHPKEHKVVHPSKFSVRAEESNGTVTYDKGTKRDNGKDAVIARGVVDEEDPENERNIVRIIPGASHCQDILYESSDLESVELREERQYVLKTFVRWIEIDVKRQERVQKQHKS